eukprot:TRINITY_DN4501_c0_g1_i2.p1 TRINITY_DN4501_c0_g1~~TRINITY_DN4501_c0_g1_i2.p1  ORF type:complete len:548 (+),score=154.80 TRINITY_DN4501_c0_g1_i2:58-1701(+)
MAGDKHRKDGYRGRAPRYERDDRRGQRAHHRWGKRDHNERSTHYQEQPVFDPTFDDLTSNHHIFPQIAGNKPGLYTSSTTIPFETVLKPDAPRAKYRRRKHEIKSVLHWGQRKLLMCEMEFLTKYGDQAGLVVYAGAASGKHIEQLAKYFPKHCFVCVDPAPFASNLVKYQHDHPKKMLLRQELFTDDLAREFEGRDCLFISDIRAADPDLMASDTIEKKVFDDQEAQMRWHNIMKPKASMLKFRLPYDQDGLTTYLKGDIWLPIWGPITTTEARLVVEGFETTEYDNMKYEEQMFHFNTITRVARYKHDVKGEGIDYCFDCRAEVGVLLGYLDKFEPQLTQEEKNVKAGTMVKEISRALGKRTLLDGNSDPGARKQGIARRQYVNGRPAYIKQQEPETQYSSQAQRMMASMNYTPGAGLGAQSQGLAEPVKASDQIERRGFGFTARTGLDQLDIEEGELPKKRNKPLTFVSADSGDKGTLSSLVSQGREMMAGTKGNTEARRARLEVEVEEGEIVAEPPPTKRADLHEDTQQSHWRAKLEDGEIEG